MNIIQGFKTKITYYLNKRKIDGLYSRACERHGGDLYLWLHMDRTRKNLNRLEKEIQDCGICFSEK